MERKLIKRKISKVRGQKARYKSTKREYILIKKLGQKNKFKVSPFVQVKPKKAKNRKEKNRGYGTVSTFALAVIKVPWYKKLKRVIFGEYEYYV